MILKDKNNLLKELDIIAEDVGRTWLKVVPEVEALS